jgi:hypothetical protein
MGQIWMPMFCEVLWNRNYKTTKFWKKILLFTKLAFLQGKISPVSSNFFVKCE